MEQPPPPTSSTSQPTIAVIPTVATPPEQQVGAAAGSSATMSTAAPDGSTESGSLDGLQELSLKESEPERAPEDTSNDAAIAASLAAAELADASTLLRMTASSSLGAAGSAINFTTPNNNMNATPNNTHTDATMSAAWQADTWYEHCYGCHEAFHVVFNRRHHCRYCGHVFCQACSNQKALISPSRIVLQPPKQHGPLPSSSQSRNPNMANSADSGYEHVSFSPDPDPDRLITYTTTTQSLAPEAHIGEQVQQSQLQPQEQVLLYGKGLEERYQLAREPLRVCRACYTLLQPIQHELRTRNAHAMRYNAIDPTHMRRHWNSPIAHTLGHEIRKAAYTLNNLLPQPKRRVGALVDYYHNPHNFSNTVSLQSELQQCRDTCSNINPNLADLDGVRIPATLLEQAKGVAVLTVIKGGFGLAGVELGTGLVVARIPQQQNGSTSTDSAASTSMQWSAPSAIGTAGLSWGALLGAQVSDHVFLLMTDAAVQVLFNNTASVQLGADIGVAVGPVGRSIEGDWAFGNNQHQQQPAAPVANGSNSTPQTLAPIYTYSMSKGLYAGVSLDGKVIVTRADVNEKFYGYQVSAADILAGHVPTPPAAQPLYEALQRCHVYATAASATTTSSAPALRNSNLPPPLPQPPAHGTSSMYEQEYGELPEGAVLPSLPRPPGAVPTMTYL